MSDETKKNNQNWEWRYGKIDDSNRSFDIQFWQNQGTEAIFDAAWEQVVDYYAFKGLNTDELRLQRSVAHFGKIQG